MIQPKKGQIIETKNNKYFAIKEICKREKGVIAIDKEGYEYFVKFQDFKVLEVKDELINTNNKETEQ